jgi:uncharacterized protein
MSLPIMLISLVFVGIGMLVSAVLKSKFKTYSAIALQKGLSGREVAERMLKENGIYDVKVVSVQGFLSDHYNPLTKTVNLSPDVYNGQSIAAAAVAAHECGHAVQHATAYQWLMLRSRIVPVVQFTSTVIPWVLFAGVVMLKQFPALLLVGIVLFAFTTALSVITLPVEIDASKKALAWLQNTNVVNSQEYPKAKDALTWAAMTYIVAAVASLVTLLYYISMYNNRQRQ